MMDGTRTTDANGDLWLQLFLWGFFSISCRRLKPYKGCEKGDGASHSAVCVSIVGSTNFFETRPHRRKRSLNRTSLSELRPAAVNAVVLSRDRPA